MESKRKHLRFTCNGSAELTDGSNGRCWRHLGDISLGGFYVSTFGPWPVGTEVRFKVETEGKEVSGVGAVVTSHPGVGMAIVYQELSDHDSGALKDVVSSLENAAKGTGDIGLKVE